MKGTGGLGKMAKWVWWLINVISSVAEYKLELPIYKMKCMATF